MKIILNLSGNYIPPIDGHRIVDPRGQDLNALNGVLRDITTSATKKQLDKMTDKLVGLATKDTVNGVILPQADSIVSRFKKHPVITSCPALEIWTMQESEYWTPHHVVT